MLFIYLLGSADECLPPIFLGTQRALFVDPLFVFWGAPCVIFPWFPFLPFWFWGSLPFFVPSGGPPPEVPPKPFFCCGGFPWVIPGSGFNGSPLFSGIPSFGDNFRMFYFFMPVMFRVSAVIKVWCSHIDNYFLSSPFVTGPRVEIIPGQL